ncbi:MAG: hypothetical protein CMJ18_12015 [Phycisphaeraceae bacterium]|nr:hypothetical protein [Phycisphaeraceae bacterium]
MGSAEPGRVGPDARPMTYLSDLRPYSPNGLATLLEAKRRTFSYGLATYQCDHSAAERGEPDDGKHRPMRPIIVGGQTFEKGIGTGTPFVLTYAIERPCRTFRAIGGVDDAEPDPESWELVVRLDDVEAGRWQVDAGATVPIEVDLRGARELVITGSGRDRMLVDLVDARLEEDTGAPTSAPGPGSRRIMFELDDRLIIDCEVLLMARSAKKIDGATGPDQSIDSLGGYGRMTAARGADVLAALRNQGDLLRWQAFVRRPGRYRVHARVVSSRVGEPPASDEYVVRIDGRPVACKRAPQTIVERAPDERFTGHEWGYLAGDVDLDYGLHDVEIENASGALLATNRVLLVPEQPASGRPVTPRISPLPRRRPPSPSPRWAPRPTLGAHYICSDVDPPFARARELGLMFAPHLVGLGGDAFNSDPATVSSMIEAGLPFSIHSRFTEDSMEDEGAANPEITPEIHERIQREAADLFLGFSSTEWSDCYVFWSTELPAAVTRAEGYARAEQWYRERAATRYDNILPMCATWHYDHYAGEWGGGVGFMDEPGVAPEVQLNILFARGAARQYDRTWHSYIAPGAHDTHNWIQNHYLVNRHPFDTQKSPTGGSSISWYKRMLYLTYMWGTASLKNESPGYETDMTPDGRTALSPMGEVADDFFAFAATHPDRGTCCTPFGIVLDRMHGWNGHPILPDICPQLSWGSVPLDASDHMKEALFQVIYPHQFEPFNEWHLLSPTPYGDIFDIMLSTATQEHLDAYPMLMTIGDVAVDMNDGLTERLDRYVRSGGTLVINVAQLGEAFPVELLGATVTERNEPAHEARCVETGEILHAGAFSARVVEPNGAKVVFDTPDSLPLVTHHRVGNGAVVLTTVPFLVQDNLNGVCFLPHMLAWLTSGLLPFQVSGDVEYVVNRIETAWFLTVINNRGVYKVPTEDEVIDERHHQRIGITSEHRPSLVTDWIDGSELTVREEGGQYAFDVEVPPGDLRILKIDDAPTTSASTL